MKQDILSDKPHTPKQTEDFSRSRTVDVREELIFHSLFKSFFSSVETQALTCRCKTNNLSLSSMYKHLTVTIT